MAWERERRCDGHGATAHGRGSAQPAQRRRKGGKGKVLCVACKTLYVWFVKLFMCGM
jgi:hypothetical protein